MARDDRHISRRAMLSGTALALAAATQAAAQQKITQAVAGYQSKPKDGKHCALCANFQPPNACKFVDGAIGPNGWCTLFSAKA